jgi:hypothetical protein
MEGPLTTCSDLPTVNRKLVLAQGLNAQFGTTNRRKRQRSSDKDVLARKKRRTWLPVAEVSLCYTHYAALMLTSTADRAISNSRCLLLGLALTTIELSQRCLPQSGLTLDIFICFPSSSFLFVRPFPVLFVQIAIAFSFSRGRWV